MGARRETLKLTRAQQQAKLQPAAAERIEQWLDGDEQTPPPNLTAFKEEVLPLRQRCGQVRRCKGQKRKTVESRLGGIKRQWGYSC
jgi:hypothetical protein